MFGTKLLPHKINILQKHISINQYGEKQIDRFLEISTNAFITSYKSKIFNEKYGIIENIAYQALIPPNIEVKKVDLVKWNNQQFLIKEILPIFDIKGKIIFFSLLLEKKE